MSFLYSDQHFEQKMLELKENDLTKRILIPLFKNLHNGKIEFVGGGPEKGKDILFTVENAYGDLELTAVQVKKVKPNADASSTNSMQNIITQLHQCKSEDAILDDGSEQTVDHLIFITPYIITQRVLDIHKGAISEAVERNVRIIDGDRIIRLANKKCPNLFDCLFEQAPAVVKNLEPLLSSDEVYRALNLSSKKDLCDIYCSVDTVIGNTSKASLLNTVITPIEKQVKVKVGITEYAFFYKEREEKYSSLFKSSFLVNKNVIEEHDAAKRTLENEIFISLARAKNARYEIEKRVYESVFRDKLKNINHPATYKKIFDDESKKLEELENNGELKLEHTKYKAFLDSIINDVNQWNVNSITIEDAKKQLNRTDLELQLSIETVCYDHAKLISEIREAYLKKEVSACLLLLEKMKLVSELLQKFESYINLQNSQPSCSTIIDLKFNIEDLIMSGKNIILLGEAGSGKTTNLKNFTKRKLDNVNEKLVLFTSLAKLYKDFKDDDSLSEKLVSFILSLGSNAERRKIEDKLNVEGTTIFLDSIDEAIPNYPTVINDIKNFSIKFPFVQIITSSRFTIEDVSSLGFSQISLLKFNRAQKNSFFNNWFVNEPEKATRIMEHLDANLKLAQVVSNPLAATILASLCEKNVPLPSNEAQLYRKRFELLCGSFDDVKGIKRTQTDPDDLMNASQLIAFHLHQKKERAISKASSIDLLEESSFQPKGVTIPKVVEELIFPAEILTVDLDGNYDFGHLRYQEYLASRELQHRTDLVLHKIVCDKWWFDSLLLLSQDTRDIKRFVYDAQKHGYVRNAPVIKEMLKNRNGKEYTHLKQIIEIAISDEHDEEIF
ncbi:hypothetical protein [Pseudoalteromonas sp. 1181_04]|uniref:hypothetical protein n=1 Tax=Pseudoalteromonas sp. 1181_04 TaxID=2604450 RepID=UPI004063A43E